MIQPKIKRRLGAGIAFLVAQKKQNFMKNQKEEIKIKEIESNDEELIDKQ